MEEKCLNAFHSEKKEVVLKLLPKLSNPETVRNTRSFLSGFTLVHYASWNGWGDVCKLLVENYNCEPTAVDDNGMSPLHIACRQGSESSVRYLVTLPSVLRRINDKDTTHGRTPLHWACEWGVYNSSGSVIWILLETNAVNISEVDKHGHLAWEVLSQHPYWVLNNIASIIY